MSTESNLPPRAFCTREESFPSPRPPSKFFLMEHSRHPGPKPNFSMTVFSITQTTAIFFQDITAISPRRKWRVPLLIKVQILAVMPDHCLSKWEQTVTMYNLVSLSTSMMSIKEPWKIWAEEISHYRSTKRIGYNEVSYFKQFCLW